MGVLLQGVDEGVATTRPASKPRASKVTRLIRRNISLVGMLPALSIPWNYGLIIRHHSFGIRMESYL